MKISPLVNFNIFKKPLENKQSSRGLSVPVFKGVIKDTFVKTDEQYLYEASRAKKLIKQITDKNDEIQLAQIDVWHNEENPKAARNNLASLEKEKIALKNKLKTIKARQKYMIFENQAEKHPNTAFLYDPELSKKDVLFNLSKKKEIKTPDLIAKEFNVHFKLIEAFIKKGLFEADEYNNQFYIDTDFEQNAKFIKSFKKVRKTSIKGTDFAENYNMQETRVKELIKSDKIKCAFLDKKDIDEYSEHGLLDLLIDLKNPSNQQLIEEHNKTTPIPLIQYYKKGKNEVPLVPVYMLSNAGYGSPVGLATLVNQKKLNGIFVKTNKIKHGKPTVMCYVDINLPENARALQQIKKERPTLVEKNEILQKTGMLEKTLLKAMKKGDIEIVKNYIFPEDKDKVYIDLTNPKNKYYLKRRGFKK